MENTNGIDDVKIYANKTKVLIFSSLFLVGALLLSTRFFSIFGTDIQDFRELLADTKAILCLIMAIFLFFVFIVLLYKLVANKAIIIMDEQGLHYNMIKPYFLRWEDINNVSVYNVSNISTLKISSNTKSDMDISMVVIDISINELKSLIYLFKKMYTGV